MSDRAFAAVPAPLRAALERRGFIDLTKVQQAVVTADRRGRDLRVSSQTGSGKTVAVGLAVAEALLPPDDSATSEVTAKAERRGPQVLLLTPTRELAAQVRAELASLFADIDDVDVQVVTGGTDVGRERKALATHPAVLVATPGRLLDHLRSGAVTLAQVSHAVLDEADQMLDLGFREELDAIVAMLPEARRLHMVSATFARAVLRFADRYQQEVLHIEGTRLGAANQDIEHIAHLVLSEQRPGALVNLLLADSARGSSSWLVFVKRRADTTSLAERLVEDGFSAMPFSGELSQVQRSRTLSAFKRGLVRVLVATDVAARGIDIQGISAVVHFDLPGDRDAFVHRSGRTGRAGQKGRSILLVPPSAERRTLRLLRETQVEAEWQPVPDARRIEKSMIKRTRRDLRARLNAADEIAAKQLDYATSLLEAHDPATVVAVLLDMARAELPREPVTVRHLEPRGEDAPDPSRPRGRGRRPGGRGHGAGRTQGRLRGRSSFKRRAHDSP